MTAETFARIIDRAKQTDVGANELFISCGFEPTIHPQFAEMMRMIPPELRAKAFLSTNLSTTISDDDIDALANANINHINISVESLVPETYEYFRCGAKYETFVTNITRLVEVIRHSSNAPQLHMISMLFKQNADEIISMADDCRRWFGITRHEVRTPFEFSLGYMSDEFKRESLLTAEEVQTIISKPSVIEWCVDHTGSWTSDMRITSDGNGL
jgi:MoaA/NifB/PqqE/SkfB family radical SAM enzyme